MARGIWPGRQGPPGNSVTSVQLLENPLRLRFTFSNSDPQEVLLPGTGGGGSGGPITTGDITDAGAFGIDLLKAVNLDAVVALLDAAFATVTSDPVEFDTDGGTDPLADGMTWVYDSGSGTFVPADPPTGGPSSWSDIEQLSGFPAVIAAGATAAAARAAIGAGTSNLESWEDIEDLGDFPAFIATGETAEEARNAINAQEEISSIGSLPGSAVVSQMPAAVPLSVDINEDATWPARPSSDPSVRVFWIGGLEGNQPSGMLTKDIWIRED